MPSLPWTSLVIDDLTPSTRRAWFEPWVELVGPATPIFLSKFGWWFLQRPAGHIDVYDVFTGKAERIAEDAEAFARDSTQFWWHETFLLSHLVRELVAAGKTTQPDECYAVPHPALGGVNPAELDQFDVETVRVVPVQEWLETCLQALRRTNARRSPSEL